MKIPTKKIDKKRSIGLTSKEIDVNEHTIRFWEKSFPQIKPNIGKGGRRYYYDKDIDYLLKIKYFLYNAGYTIKGLQNLLKNNKDLLNLDLDVLKGKKIINNNISEYDENNKNITTNINQNTINEETINKIFALKTKLNKFVEKFDNFSF